MRIDAHQHFWKFDPARHEWITPEMESIRKNFLPDDLLPLLMQASFDGSITVQVDQTAKETLILLRWADQHPFIKGVVGWIDFRAEEVGDRLAYLKRYRKLKGFRHIVQAEPDGFLLQKNFLRGIKCLAQHMFTYDLLVYPHQLEECIQFVSHFPDQKFVLNHLAKPDIKKRSINPWRDQVKRLASAGQVHCKLSGMVTEAGWKQWNKDDFRPYLDTVLEVFGTQRLIYGSDWPVCLVAATYQQQLGIVETFIDPLTTSEKQAIMGQNAAQFYNL